MKEVLARAGPPGHHWRPNCQRFLQKGSSRIHYGARMQKCKWLASFRRILHWISTRGERNASLWPTRTGCTSNPGDPAAPEGERTPTSGRPSVGPRMPRPGGTVGMKRSTERLSARCASAFISSFHFGPDGQAIAVPIEDLEAVAATIAKDEEMTGEGLLADDLCGQGGQAVEAAAHLDMGQAGPMEIGDDGGPVDGWSGLGHEVGSPGDGSHRAILPTSRTLLKMPFAGRLRPTCSCRPPRACRGSHNGRI